MLKAFVLGCVVSVFFTAAQRAFAEGLQIRAVLANPIAAEETEWIALENTSSATVSASGYTLRDTYGSVKNHLLSGNLAPSEVWVLPRTHTSITLNNDRESVELLQNSTIEQQVPELTSPGNDQVWINLGDEWQYVTLIEWQQRLATKDWSVTASSEIIQPSSSSTTLTTQAKLELALVSPCTSPEWIEVRASSSGRVNEIRVEDSSGIILQQEDLEFSQGEFRRIEWAGAKLSNTGEWVRIIFPHNEELFSYGACSGTFPFRFFQGKWQQSDQTLVETPSHEEKEATSAAIPELPVASLSFPERLREWEQPALLSTISAQDTELVFQFPEVPLPDFSTEKEVFQQWKRRSLFGSLSLIFSGGSALLLTLPHLVAWYNDHRDPW